MIDGLDDIFEWVVAFAFVGNDELKSVGRVSVEVIIDMRRSVIRKLQMEGQKLDA
jgi:hypothetical protein